MVQAAVWLWLHTTLDHQFSMKKETTEGSTMILYGIKWKCKGQSNATDGETA